MNLKQGVWDLVKIWRLGEKWILAPAVAGSLEEE
jgi:hypothetical protein